MKAPEFIHKVKQTIDENRGQLMRLLAKKLHLFEKTIWRNVHEDIRYKFFVMKRGQFISEKSKENRLNWTKRLLNKLKNLPKQNISPPISPILNPLDYYMWCVIEKEVHEHPHNIKDCYNSSNVWPK